MGSYTYQMEITEDYNYSESDPNENVAFLISEGQITRSLGYQNDSVDWYYIPLNSGDLLRVEYYNIQDANVEVYIYDPEFDLIKSTDWSWTTVLQIIAQETDNYFIKVEYDNPGIYCLEIDTIQEEENYLLKG